MNYASSFRCANGAPFIAYQTGAGVWHIVQGSCNSWLCPRCGQIRAKKEYGRLVHGSTELSSDHTLYLFTITTRGSGLSVADAHKHYYEWTNRLFSALRANAKSKGSHWAYAQVTEHQKRGHPHSHLVTTYRPHDVRWGWFWRWKKNGSRAYKEYYETLRSKYLLKRIKSAGLGEVYDFNEVRDPQAASRYIAKYLFKDSMFTDEFPKNWRRIRYSRNWPKLPKREGSGFPLIEPLDWQLLAHEAVGIYCDDEASREEAFGMLRGADVILLRKDKT